MGALTEDDFSSSPRLIRFCDWLSIGPAWIGACTTLAYYVVFSLGGLALWAIGYEDLRWDDKQIPIDVVQAAAVGYIVAAVYYGRRGAARDLIALRPALTCSSVEFDTLLTRLRRTDSWVHIGSVGGMVAGIWVVSLDAYWAEDVPLGSQMMNLHMAKMALSSALIGYTFAVEIFESAFFAEVARRYVRIDLLELERIDPLTTRALRSVLVLMLFSAIISTMIFITPTPELAGYSVALFVLLALAMFWVPLRPLRRLIDAEKRAELARVRAAIRREASARVDGTESWAPSDSRLADLIVYESRVERVNSWALSTPTTIRFGLYVSVGIGSWLGAALVERWLDVLLTR